MSILADIEARGKLWVYDVSIDGPREATQADIERLVFSEQAFGALIMAMRELVKPRPHMLAEDRMKLMRKFKTAIDSVSEQ